MGKSAVTRSEHTFFDAYGVRIHYYVWEAAKPKAVVQVVHGLGDHALRYEELAQRLVKAGYTVYADDHRGHGATGMEQYGDDTSKLGRLGPGGVQAANAEVMHLSAIIHADHPKLPIALLGHSWGSIIAQTIINRHAADYDAVVLTGTAYRTLKYMNSGNLNAKHKHLGKTGFEWLSRDPAVAEDFVNDPLTFYANVRKLFGVAEGTKLLGKPDWNFQHRIPLLIMIGGEDPLGGPESVAKLVEAYVSRSGLTDVEAKVYPEARHEIFRETNREEIMNDLVAWLDARLAT